MKTRHLLMVAALAGAAGLALFGDKTPATLVVEPTRVVNSSAGVRPQGNVVQATQTGEDVLAVRDRSTLIRETAPAGTPVRVFAPHDWTPPPPPAPAPPPPPPPTAPPLPFTFVGKKLEAGVWEVYLANGNETYIVREKSTISETYRVDSIKPPQLSLTYLPLNQSQSLAIGVSD